MNKQGMPRKKCRTLVVRLLSLIIVFILITNIIDYFCGTDSAIIKIPDWNTELKDEVSWVFVGDEQELGQDPVQYDIGDCNCKIPRMKNLINRKGSWDNKESADQCKRVKPQCGSCKFADEIFHSFSPTLCTSQRQIEICRLQAVRAQDVPHVHCNISVCNGNVTLSALNPDTGEMVDTEVHSADELVKIITDMISPNSQRKHYGFLFLKCFQPSVYDESYRQYSYEFNERYNDEFKQTDIQMVLLPPKINFKRNFFGSNRQKSKNKHININFIFLDSVSRHHFYRSLPKTIELLESLNADKERKSLALDFQLMQSIKSRTFESLQALFSGYVNTVDKPFGILDMPPTPLGIEGLFKLYKDNGYHTLWLEDMCWLWEWGLSKDLLFHNKSSTVQETWKRMTSALKNKSIDNLDITLSSCQFLDGHGVKDPFYGPDAICMNGHHQHEYFFKYLRLYQKKLFEAGEPFFTFLESNVNHDNTGIRIQPFDAPFAKYLQFAASLPNTLTIIASDHGNSYGRFIEHNLEGRFELYHPAFFMIIPSLVVNHLGKKRLESLIINQHRLLSLLDLHFTLLSLITDSSKIHIPKDYRKYSVSSNGLFEEISPNRTCDQIPRVSPNLCICENFEEPVENSTLYAHYALFAIGQLNNVLLEQYKKSHKETVGGFGRCQRLIPSNFTNIRMSHNKDDSVVVKMDIWVPHSMSEKSSKMEIFFVSIKYNRDQSKGYTLQTFSRMTPYSPFKQCADKNVDLSLCICDLKENRNQEISLTAGAKLLRKNLILTSTQIKTIEGANNILSNKCFFIVVRNNDAGSSFEGVNLCISRTFLLTFKLLAQGMAVSKPTSEVKVKLSFGDIKYLMSTVVLPTAKVWQWTYKVSLSEV